ncbi:MAG: phage tail protein, partial [Gemmatimonadetes bacterium]|nr:phage tail protein [Gemmatimonadota bacterium]
SPPPHHSKLAGVGRVPEIALRHGEVGDGGGLFRWLEGIRQRGPGTLRTVTVQLLDPQHPGRSLQQWKLSNACVLRYTGPELNARSGEVAIEELVLESERIDVG